MSGDEISREAHQLTEEENRKLDFELRPFTPAKMQEWLKSEENKTRLAGASEKVRAMADRKIAGYIEQPTVSEATASTIPEAPAIIEKLSSSTPPQPPESMDVEYLTSQEIKFERAINTINTVLVEDHEIERDTHMGPWIERCVGRNPKTFNLIVQRIPARERKIPPWEVVQYNGSVIKDKMATHSTTVIIGGDRIIYVFDRFFIHNKKRYDRCCWIPDPVHQAGLIYVKRVNPKTKFPIAVINTIDTTNDPKYEVVGARDAGGTIESYYRDLKRHYERHFLRRGDGADPEDTGLQALIHKIQPN